MTELAPTLLDADDARRLTERIRLIAGNVADNVEKLRDLVEQARVGEAHAALGYASWTAYLLDVFGDEPLRLAGDVRRELSAELAEQGMSTRAIGGVLGVSDITVRRDIAATATYDAVDPATAEVDEALREIVGLNGKNYTTPVQKQNRRALPDVAKDAGWDIRKAAERLDRIRDDDRYSRNKEEVAALLRSHLLFTIETCQGLLDDFENRKEIAS
jgi:hypothetical protein